MGVCVECGTAVPSPARYCPACQTSEALHGSLEPELMIAEVRLAPSGPREVDLERRLTPVGDGMLPSTFHRRARAAVAALWVVGISIAVFTAPRAWQRTGAISALPFAVVAVAGVRLTVGVLRAERWALAVSLFLLGAQVAGVIGAAWQLMSGVHGMKARELQRLGLDPVFGVGLNLAFSAVAVLVFSWVGIRWWRLRRGRLTSSGRTGHSPDDAAR